MTIRRLPEEVASAIAAGEVIERPASVVKELLENALDAGARSVQITTRRGGRALIEVADDGEGIAPDELALAVLRHATSKVATAQDLFAIQTLGFRGEALYSIAAVARLEIVSRTAGRELGARLAVEGGRAAPLEAVGAPPGTLVRVRDLFYNLPARQKFLKSETTERRRIEALAGRYALAFPEVRLRLEQDGRMGFHSPGNGDRREVLAGLYGVQVARQMITLAPEDLAPIRVSGFLSPPTVHRSNRREITLFINHRWVQDPGLSAAVLQAYQGLLMVGRYPMAVLFVDLAPEEVDVNVHPAKAEVRFREPDRVFAAVQRAVRAALLGQAPAPALQLNWRWGGEAPAGAPRPSPDWALAHAGAGAEPGDAPPQPGLPHAGLPLLRAVGQIGSSYLVAEGPDGLYLVDQHAAHERVLFEALMRARETGPLDSQALLEPAAVHLPPWQAQALESQRAALNGLGFEVEPFGGGSFRVRAVPALLAALDPEAALRCVVEDFEEDEAPLEAELERRLAARVCKRAAVRSGQLLSLAEQERLLRDLEACRSPRTCPHGRPTMIHLSVEALERQFGRRG